MGWFQYASFSGNGCGHGAVANSKSGLQVSKMEVLPLKMLLGQPKSASRSRFLSSHCIPSFPHIELNAFFLARMIINHLLYLALA